MPRQLRPTTTTKTRTTRGSGPAPAPGEPACLGCADRLMLDSCAAESGFMGQLWAGRRTKVDVLADIGPRKSLGHRMEAGRQLGYQSLRSLRDRLRHRSGSAAPKKLTRAA